MIEKDIANLVYYAQKHLHLDSEDALFYGNILLKIFRRERPYEGELDTASLDSLAVPDSDDRTFRALPSISPWAMKKGGLTAKSPISWAYFRRLPSQVNDGL
jgi:hypothetical protein